MRGLPVRLFSLIARAISWNSDFYLRAVPAVVYWWDNSCVLG